MEKQGLNELAAAVHENAVAHGWWEQERELPEILMLCVSELAEAQAAREKEQEDEDQRRADAVDMMKHIAAAFDIPAVIDGKEESHKNGKTLAEWLTNHSEQQKEARELYGWYSELKKAGFTDAQAFELIKG